MSCKFLLKISGDLQVEKLLFTAHSASVQFLRLFTNFYLKLSFLLGSGTLTSSVPLFPRVPSLFFACLKR